MEINLIPRLIKGRVIEVNDMGVKVEFLGRMGVLQVPLRMVVTDKPIEVNDEVEIYMSYVQVISKSDSC